MKMAQANESVPIVFHMDVYPLKAPSSGPSGAMIPREGGMIRGGVRTFGQEKELLRETRRLLARGTDSRGLRMPVRLLPAADGEETDGLFETLESGGHLFREEKSFTHRQFAHDVRYQDIAGLGTRADPSCELDGGAEELAAGPTPWSNRRCGRHQRSYRSVSAARPCADNTRITE